MPQKLASSSIFCSQITLTYVNLIFEPANTKNHEVKILACSLLAMWFEDITKWSCSSGSLILKIEIAYVAYSNNCEN